MLWMVGACLRLTVLAVPPIIPLLHADLHLSESQVGLLSSLPPLLFAIAAVPGALLIARLGIGRALLIGLLLNAIGSVARGAFHNIGCLYLATIVMAAGISVNQPIMPPLVRARFPDRIGFATAVYMNGLLVGEIIVVSLTIPVVLPLVGHRWEPSFAVWTLPVLLTAGLVLAFRRTLVPQRSPQSARAASWFPDWRNPLIWRLGLLLGSVNAIYFGANAFLPDFATAAGHPELVGSALAALNAGQLPASFLMLAFAGRLVRRPAAYSVTALASLLSIAGIMTMGGGWIVFWSGALGFFNAVALVLAFALPSILSEPQDVHRTSAGMFTISYGWAMAISILSGCLWDWTGSPLGSMAPLALCAIILAIAASAVRPPPRSA